MIPHQTIACCTFVHNDLAMLRATLPYEMRWADQICILDMASTDGTAEFCHAFLRPGDRYARRSENTCPTKGFAEAKNAVMQMADTDWVYFGAANCVLDWCCHHNVERVLSEAKSNVLSITTCNMERHTLHGVIEMERAVTDGFVRQVQSHRNILKRTSGCEFKGYVHEEPYHGDMNCVQVAEAVPLRRFHFEGSGNNKLRSQRYAWMLKRAIENPELQNYTNRWWYETYWPAHKEELLVLAAQYEQIGIGK